VNDRQFPRQDYVSEKPRRVRGGLKLSDSGWSLGMHGVARRWLDLLEASAAADIIRLGADYARKGQTRTLRLEPGRITASVQGRVSPAYRVTIDVPVITPEQWETILRLMGDQAIHAARLLSGELPGALDELFQSVNLSVPPPAAAELRATCTCSDAQAGQVWCKHACCTALLTAQELQTNPFLIFTLRGMPGDALAERLRERRSTGAATNTRARVGGIAAVPGVDAGKPLESEVDRFWEAGSGLSSLQTPLRAPEVSNAILRRLGPSPFAEGKFPLVGLLATCYETISHWAITPEIELADSGSSDPDQNPDESSDPG